ncbi:MAG: dockerin type I repeat protein [halophilic archaeon J07HB67]|nr:MAG: dockerin type I repeat protein [halophilic archaeon J07HB67]
MLLGNAVETAANPPGPAGTISVSNETIAPSENTTVSVETTAANVSGYEVTVTFDPQKLQVTDVAGVDMADPVVSLDNDAGELVLTQAQATAVDSAELARVDFDTTAMTKGESATIDVVGSASEIYDTNGSAYISEVEPGEVDVLQAELGDVNADGEITAGDAVIVQRFIAGLPTDTPDSQVATLADLNEDGAVTSADVTAILQVVADNDEGDSDDQQSSVDRETPRSVDGQTAVVA